MCMKISSDHISHDFLFQASIWNSNFEFFQPLSELTDGVGWIFFSLLSTYDFNINHRFKKFCVPPSWLRAMFAVIYEFSAAFQTTWNIVKRLFEVWVLCEAKITKNCVLRWMLGGVDGDSAMNFHQNSRLSSSDKNVFNLFISTV